MLTFTKIILSAVFVITCLTFSFGKKYNCDIRVNKKGKTCRLDALNLTRTDYIIEPVTKDATELIRIIITGTVPILAKGICEALPNLKSFEANTLHIEEIEEDAFVACKKLTRLNLHINKLIKLKKNTFSGLVHLEQLFLPGGNLSTIDIDLRGLKQLQIIVLAALNLTVFRPEMIQDQTQLERLALYSNELFNLDIDELLKYTPNLKRIDLADNNFKCSRLEEIVKIARMKNINARTFTYTALRRNRTYTPGNVDGIHCLSDEQFKSEFTSGEFPQQRIVH